MSPRPKESNLFNFRRLKSAAIISTIILFLIAIVDMALGMDWVGDLLSLLVVIPLFVVSYFFVPLVTKYIKDN